MSTAEEEGIKLGRALTIIVILSPLRSWLVMLGFGVLHNDWSSAIPALGFWACLLLSLAFAWIMQR